MARVLVKKPLDLKALLTTRFEARPKPINCTTLLPTTVIAQDSRHPLNIPVTRRLDDWNPNRLHWGIRTPISVSKKRTIRSWVTKRVREAFIDELKNKGFNRRGEPVLDSQTSLPLTGALIITLRQPVLTAPIEDVREGCRITLQNIINSNDKPQSPRRQMKTAR